MPALIFGYIIQREMEERSEKSGELVRARKQLDDFAYLLDNCFQIPGVGWRFGIESLIGLIPGLGDVISGILALVLLLRAIQFRLPAIVIIRMALNSLIDLAIGAIPLIGDLFDMYWKSNTRNMKLFHQYAGQRELSTRRHWIFLAGLIGGFVISCVGVIATTLWLLNYFFTR